MSHARSYSLSVLSGLLLALAFPPFGFSLAAWFALVPLLLIVTSGSGNTFLQGLLAGVVFRALAMYWIVPMLHGYAQASWVVSAGAFALLITYLSCYTGVFAWAVGKVTDRWGPAAALLAPIFWVALEYGNAHLFTGFHWNPLSASQAHHLRLVQVAEFSGAYGVSFLVVFVNTALCMLLSSWLQKGLRTSRRLAYAAVGVTAALLTGTFLWGGVRLEALERQKGDLQPLHARLVNPAVPQDVKWTLGHYREALDRLATLSRGAPAGTDLIVWPEAALPFYFEQDPLGLKAVYDLAKELQAPILLGAPGQRLEGDTMGFTNSAYLVTPEGEVAGRYDKQRLVPFGEYVPLRALLPFIPAVARGLAWGDLSPGAPHKPLMVGEARLGLLVCYEVIFPTLVAGEVERGANLLVNLSNDAWLGSAGLAQHLAMARLRATELRVPLLRLANRGMSGVIEASGQFTCRLPASKPASGDCTVFPAPASHGLKRLRAVFPLACAVLSTALLWACLYLGFRPARHRP